MKTLFEDIRLNSFYIIYCSFKKNTFWFYHWPLFIPWAEPPNSQGRPWLGCGSVETSQHLFISCDFYGTLWFQVRSWLGVSGPDPFIVSDHFLQFTHSAGGARAKRSFMQLVWLLCAWIIWNDWNQRLFNNIGSSIDQLLDKVKRLSLWWLKASNVVFVFGSDLWWSKPLDCLGLG
jgi:hypothetical protein